MKKAFTLLEVVICVAILGLIISMFSNSILNYKKHSEWFLQKTTNSKDLELTTKALYSDLISARQVFISQYGNYSVVNIISSNTLYGNNNPNIIWYVLNYKNSIIRLESKNTINLPIAPELKNEIYASEFANGCEEFKVLESKQTFFVKISINGSSMQFATKAMLNK